jgi:hypothetical protein
MEGTQESSLEVGKIYELGTVSVSVPAQFSEYAEDNAPRFTPVGSHYPFRKNVKGFIEFEPRPDHIWYEPKTQENEKAD